MIRKEKIIIFLAIVALIILGVWAYQNKSLFLPAEAPGERLTERQKEHPELLMENLLVVKERIPWAELGDTVVVDYKGMFLDGSVFSSSEAKGRPFIFQIGDGTVIQGWEMGVEGMRPGEKRKLTIPPELAYGEGGVRNLVPPNTTVVFEIELLEIK